MIWRCCRRPRYMKDHRSKVVLVTHADYGIGSTIVHNFDRLGLDVYAACTTTKGEHALLKTCSNRVTIIKLDTNRPKTTANLVQKRLSHRPLWAIINCPPSFAIAGVEWFSVEECQLEFETNVWNCIEIIRSFLPLIKKSQGRIVNVVSSASRVGHPEFVPFTMAMFGLEAFCKSLREDLRERNSNIKVISILNEVSNVNLVPNDDAIARKSEIMWQKLDQETYEEHGDPYFVQCKIYLLSSSYNSI